MVSEILSESKYKSNMAPFVDVLLFLAYFKYNSPLSEWLLFY